ncbi:hypothetical protein [Ideonella sp.]|jgi:oligosaccharide repeat unit polymerase|uniref:hypothetical protein n=1 Tax=Ideonella sp. TaxID=1929293 RepID=UPI0037C02849
MTAKIIDKHCAQDGDLRPQHLPQNSKTRQLNLFEKALVPQNGLFIFSAILLVVYAIAPAAVYLIAPVGESFLLLSLITICAVTSMLLGSQISLFDSRFKPSAPRLAIDRRVFIAVTWLIFIAFVLITFSTAPSIPIWTALRGGATSNELSQERGEFLKGREGAGIALLYISTFLVNTIVPYSIVLLYRVKSSLRHWAAAVFFLFCISFMQKALFLNLILPLLVFLAITRKLSTKIFLPVIFGTVGLLLLTTALSLAGEGGDTSNTRSSDYLTALYAPSNPIDYFIWRAAAVPIFTATDTLVVHSEQFGSRPLMGATSTLISSILGIERINLERFVFEHQFGGWNDTANSNAVFCIDAYVNFGWPGVVIFGLIIGLTFRWFKISTDIGFQSLWLIFAFVLFSAPLIGMLLSNGFAYMLLHGLYIRVDRHGT